MPNAIDAATVLFQKAGELFNDASVKMIGGIDQFNETVINNDLKQAQALVQQMITEDAKALDAAASIHAQEIVDQIGLELSYVSKVEAQTTGTATNIDLFAAKGVNDVHRDIIDIVQGDATLSHLAGDGFTSLPAPIGSPAPFQLNDAQTAFLKQFDLAVTNLGNESIALVNQAHPSVTDVQTEITKLMEFATNADKFSASQGGLYSARFDNELRLDGGNNGTIVKELISGLQNHDQALVIEAANQLVQNASDVSGNQAANDGSHPTPAPLATASNVAVVQTPAPTPAVPDPNGEKNAGHQAANLNTPGIDQGSHALGAPDHAHGHAFGHTHWDHG